MTEATVPSGPKMRILLVEDDPEQARLVTRWLEADGRFTVNHAADGPEGAERVRSEEWAIVVSDIELPGLNGLELLRISKQARPYTPTLLITAHESLEYAMEAIRGKADDFLVKPLRRDTFLEKVRSLVARAAEERRKRQNVVLAVGAHPDDVEIGVGGILLRHRSEGDSVTVLTLTGGEQGGQKSDRVLESERAAGILGARLITGDLRDASISEGQETIRLIEDAISEVRPTTIYTHTVHDGHQDHRAVYRATIVAARGVPNLYCYQAPSTNIDFRPSVFVDVGEYLDRKIEAIGAFHSQTAVRPYLRESMIRSTAEYWGRFAGYRLVEPLEVVRRSA
jgi:LmbE family N-acetylglucosaminyl deacetylase/CheY-like chemotaxis protein